MRALIIFALLTSPMAWAAEEVGRKLNFQTPGSPNYVEPSLPTDEAYRLPDLPKIGDLPTAAEQRLSNSPTIMVREIVVTGSTALDPALIDEISAPYENRAVAVEELEALRLKLSKAYLDNGFVNSGVVIPDQDVKDGIIELRAIEGNLTRIDFEGEPRLRFGYIEGRLQRRIKDPLNVGDIQDALRYLQRDPLIDRLDARLAPGDRLGDGVLKLSVAEPKRFEVGLAADNHHASSVGAERGRLLFKSQNLTGFGEVLRMSGSFSEGSDELNASLTVPLNSRNTNIQAYYSDSDADIIEDAFDALDIKSKTQTRGIILTQPFVDNLRTTFSVSLGFENKTSESELLGVRFSLSPGAQNGKAETNSALFGVDWVRRGDNSVLGLRGTWRKGLDTGDATIFDPDSLLESLDNPTGVDAEYDLVLLQGLYLHRLNSFGWFSGLNDRAQLVLRTTAQLANDPLLSLEKIAIGGADTVRGYQENLLVRDSGVASTIELQLPIFGYRSDPHPLNLIVAPFLDVGTSWDDENTDITSTVRDTSDKRTIWGAGVGLIWLPINNLRAQIYWGDDFADNFDHDDPRDSDSRDRDLQDDGIHFAMSYFVQF